MAAAVLGLGGGHRHAVTDAWAGATDAPPPPANANAPRLTLSPAGSSQSIHVGDTLEITATARDPDGDRVSISTGPLPAGASLSDGTGSRRLTWTPTEATTATINFKARDYPGNGSAARTTSHRITIAVHDDQAPELQTIASPQTVIIGTRLQLPVAATAADSTATVIFDATGMPKGASLKAKPPADGRFNALFRWKPSAAQLAQGSYTVGFIARDNARNPLQSAQDVVFQVAPGLTVAAARWNRAGSTIGVNGRVMASRGFLAQSLRVRLTDGSGGELDTVTVDGKGRWNYHSAPRALASAPCTVKATLLVGESGSESTSVSKPVRKSGCQ
jgi:hypothetical protein